MAPTTSLFNDLMLLRFDTTVRKLLDCAVSSEGFPSGQREQTVNLPALPSKVRILPPPPLGNQGSGVRNHRFLERRGCRAGDCRAGKGDTGVAHQRREQCERRAMIEQWVPMQCG